VFLKGYSFVDVNNWTVFVRFLSCLVKFFGL
jgi:hypothetical protein